MPVIDIQSDLDNRSLTITAQFHAPIKRVWQVYADPRQLEKIWGPPGYPATVVDHDLTPGGRVSYYMTGPEGDKHGGWWRVITVDEPHSFTFEDGFADVDADLEPVADMPVSMNTYTFAEHDGGTRATYVSRFESTEALQQMLEMGMAEGAKGAIGQIDDLLTA